MENSLVTMITHASWVAKLVLVLLAIESLISWAIIAGRLAHVGRVDRHNLRFKEKYAAGKSLAESADVDPGTEISPLAQLAHMVSVEMKRIADCSRSYTNVKEWSLFFDHQLSMVQNRFESMIPALSTRTERGAYFLAIISSSAPFLGLLGTVWGIMDAFFQISAQGSASLQVVAPGIAESLVATVIGLFVAIPAVFFYNYIMHRAQQIEDQMGEFRGDLLFRLKGELFGQLFDSRTSSVPAVNKEVA